MEQINKTKLCFETGARTGSCNFKVGAWEMISEGEKKYLEHAIELAEYIDQQPMTGNLKSEILDKMLIPYGLSDEKKNETKQASSEQSKNQPAQSQAKSQVQPVKPKTDSVMDIVNAHHDQLSVSGDKVIVAKAMDKEAFFDMKYEFSKKGWVYIAAKHIGGERWEPGYFEMGVKA